MKHSNSPPKKRSLKDLLRFFFGFKRYPPYIENRLREADVRSCMFLSAVVGMVEIGMIIRSVIKFVIIEGKIQSAASFLSYTFDFWYLLAGSAVLCFYCLMYLRKRLRNLEKYSKLVIFLYFASSMLFGIRTSVSDFSHGRMITCFLTIMMFVTVICVWRPVSSLLLTLVYGAGFVWILNHYSFDSDGSPLRMNSADLLNYITFIIVIVILEMAVFIQRYSDATKSYRLDQKSQTDELTGIPNMRKFDADAKQYAAKCAAENKTPFYLVFDILNFHTFNDRFGYEGGDDLLIQTGQRIAAAFPDEPAARESGDCFCVLTTADDFLARAEKIRDGIRAAYPEETYLNVRLGAFRSEQADRSARFAVDRARYAVKQIKTGEQFFSEYDAKMSSEYSMKQYVLNNVERAVKAGHIKVYYQPVVRSDDGTVCGCEALARWIDPEKGFMSPGVFVPVLEEGRQIHKLDLCIYEQVCRGIRECLDSGKPALPVSLNFSRLDFELMDAVGELEKLVQQYDIPKEYLHVEITESALTNDVDGLKKAIGVLHEKGYLVWLDDFGAGYSSLNVLKDFQFDLLKLDMEFLRGFHDNKNARKIVETIIALADKLDMKTLAEGVETEEVARFLREAGCGRQQGYFYGKPMPYEEILAKLGDGSFRLAAGIPEE
ncbi:MAG: EAL domain-containing protein [Oscillospiraceae bacterium]|nr:EAL domain-containing protein [Oscillospiraceae bacterium]